MQKIRKYTILGILCIILIIPIIFGIYTEYLFISELSLMILFIFILGLIIFLLIDKLIANYGYDIQSFEAIKKQDVINALISKNNKAVIWIFLPIIMIIEELIFRYYLIGFLLNQIGLDVFSALFISSLIFSLFHIHIWFRFKNRRILLINLGDSFILGLFNGYILITLGIFLCILVHFSLVFFLYYSIYKKHSKNNPK